MTGSPPTPGQLPRRAAAQDGPDAVAPGVAGDDPRVADAVSRLSELDTLPLREQVEVFTDIHRRLAAVLADPDSRA